MKRAALILVAVFAARAALAQNEVDLTFARFQPKKLVVRESEPFTLRLTIANRGPAHATNPRLYIFSSEWPAIFTVAEAPAGWECGARRYTDHVECSIPFLPAGAEHELRIEMLIPPLVRARLLELQAKLVNNEPDRAPANNDASVWLTVNEAETSADLHLSHPFNPVPHPLGATVSIPLNVENKGPHDARNVLVIINRGTNAPFPPRLEGDGWSCEQTGAEQMACTRPLLKAKTSAPIAVQFQGGPRDSHIYYIAQAFAEETSDSSPPHDVLVASFGFEKAFKQVLLPLVRTDTPGNDGALWKTELRMIVRGSKSPLIHPHLCDFQAFDCDRGPVPLNRPFDPRNAGMIYPEPRWPGGHFIYIDLEDWPNVQLNGRIYDASRDSEGAGAELPIPTGDDFTAGTITLFDIPLAPELRHNLRMYSLSNSFAYATIRVYADDETAPRATFLHTLRSFDLLMTTQRMPVRPAYAELDPSQFADLAGAKRMRVEIEARDQYSGCPLWAFLTVTNVDTHQVTAFTPQ